MTFKRSNRTYHPALLAVILAVGLLSTTSAVDASPGDPQVVAEQVPSEEVRLVAADRSISPELAEALLINQSELASYVRTVSEIPSYVDFKFSSDGMSGEFLVEPGTDFASPFGPTKVPANAKVVEASASKAERERSYKQVNATATSLAGSSFVGMSYDAFDNSFLVVLDGTAAPAELDSELDNATFSARATIGATIAVDRMIVGDRFRGGQLATKSVGGACTTGFGINASGAGAYLTAGHCGAGTWTINGNTSSSVQGISISTYSERARH